ncbi:Protein RER1 [Apostichopus japonicus]|uniref:Protein RER1 n=1 Tax=Stichopus japonicus TaxID=307972 RepID=A0A2G8JN70_STIJA|nr:Protein RER1 [Apostichopus japonicus]
MEPDPSDVVSSQPGFLSRFFTGMSQRYQTYLDRSVPHSPARWVATLLLEFCYLGRVFFLQGWYIVTYALGIYQLNLFIAFLTPKMEPVITEDSEDDGPTLPTKANEEFRPFIRRLPEFKFWYSATKSIVIASFCTFFDIFNVPVFWRDIGHVLFHPIFPDNEKTNRAYCPKIHNKFWLGLQPPPDSYAYDQCRQTILLNKRPEQISTCRHENKFYLSSFRWGVLDLTHPCSPTAERRQRNRSQRKTPPLTPGDTDGPYLDSFNRNSPTGRRQRSGRRQRDGGTADNPRQTSMSSLVSDKFNIITVPPRFYHSSLSSSGLTSHAAWPKLPRTEIENLL